jgi:carboxyl-terminal processing protease
LLDRAGRKIVYDVRPGTPAQAAGIVAGDAIVTIDGKDASGESLDDVRRAFFAPAGTVVRLGLVAKDGAPRTATLILRDYV